MSMRQFFIRQAPTRYSPKSRREPLQISVLAGIVAADLFVKIPL